MRRKIIATLLMLIIVTHASGFQTVMEWMKYTSVQGRYTALFPQQPKLSSEEYDTPMGEKYLRHLAQSTDSDSLYAVRHFDLLRSMSFSLEKMRDAAVRNLRGELLGTKEISIAGSAGLELKVLLKDESGVEFLLRDRIFMVERRVYSLEHFVPKSLDSPTVTEKANKFFDSFKVTADKQQPDTRPAN